MLWSYQATGYTLSRIFGKDPAKKGFTVGEFEGFLYDTLHNRFGMKVPFPSTGDDLKRELRYLRQVGFIDLKEAEDFNDSRIAPTDKLNTLVREYLGHAVRPNSLYDHQIGPFIEGIVRVDNAIDYWLHPEIDRLLRTPQIIQAICRSK